MKVIAFVGPNGAGKTTLVRALSDEYTVLESNYRKLNIHKLPNESLVSKWSYVSFWINSLIEAKRTGIDTMLSDRTPYDSCAYIEKGRTELMSLVALSVRELSVMGISVTPVLITANTQILEDRISDRKGANTIDDPTKEKLEIVSEFYSSNAKYWPEKIDTSNLRPEEVADKCRDLIKKVI